MSVPSKNPYEVLLGASVLASGLMCFLGDGGKSFLALFVVLVIAASTQTKQKTPPGR